MSNLIGSGANQVPINGMLGNAAFQDAAQITSGNFPGYKNKLRNAFFRVNQRAVSGTVTLAAGAYGHDGWKAGASGATYTFAASGGVTTLTITAGSLQQVIDGANLQTATHCMSWAGTAQGKIGTGAYSASGVTSLVTGGTPLTLEFGTGTVSVPTLHEGVVPVVCEMPTIGLELEQCYRYYRARLVFVATAPDYTCIPINMRATPTITGGGIGFVSTGTTADTLICTQTTSNVQSLILNADL